MYISMQMPADKGIQVASSKADLHRVLDRS